MLMGISCSLSTLETSIDHGELCRGKGMRNFTVGRDTSNRDLNGW